jgi:hypothetical protein
VVRRVGLDRVSCGRTPPGAFEPVSSGTPVADGQRYPRYAPALSRAHASAPAFLRWRLTMWSRSAALYAICIGYAAVGVAHPVAALTLRECSAKYQAAKSSGTLGGSTWQQFRRDNCGPGAAGGSATVAPPNGSATAAPKAARPMGFNPGPGPVFPQTIAPKYANEPAGRARMHTCLDQYRANKQSSGNAGLRWITKGGGYYSECNKRLKG